MSKRKYFYSFFPLKQAIFVVILTKKCGKLFPNRVLTFPVALIYIDKNILCLHISMTNKLYVHQELGKDKSWIGYTKNLMEYTHDIIRYTHYRIGQGTCIIGQNRNIAGFVLLHNQELYKLQQHGKLSPRVNMIMQLIRVFFLVQSFAAKHFEDTFF